MADNDANSGRTIELNIMRREMDRVQQERLSHLEMKLDDLDEWVRQELLNLDQKIDSKLKKHEDMFVERTARLSVKQAFYHLGVDVDKPEDLKQFRNDLEFGSTIRNAASKSMIAVLLAVCGAIGATLWTVFKNNFGIK